MTRAYLMAVVKETLRYLRAEGWKFRRGVQERALAAASSARPRWKRVDAILYVLDEEIYARPDGSRP